MYILDYLIPLCIKSRADTIKTKLDIIIKDIANRSNTTTNTTTAVATDSATTTTTTSEFNVPDYFFVSTNVAKKRPELLESRIILAYKATTPNDISANVNKVLSTNINSNTNRFSIMIVVSLLKTAVSSLALVLPFLLIQIGLNPEFMQTLIVR